MPQGKATGAERINPAGPDAENPSGRHVPPRALGGLLSEIANDSNILQGAAKTSNLATAAWTLFEMALEEIFHLRTQATAESLVTNEIQKQFFANRSMRKVHKEFRFIGEAGRKMVLHREWSQNRNRIGDEFVWRVNLWVPESPILFVPFPKAGDPD